MSANPQLSLTYEGHVSHLISKAINLEQLHVDYLSNKSRDNNV